MIVTDRPGHSIDDLSGEIVLIRREDLACW
ncbi:MAG: hypothetical protein ACI87E_002308 [Mariniblastus sp.]